MAYKSSGRMTFTEGLPDARSGNVAFDGATAIASENAEIFRGVAERDPIAAERRVTARGAERSIDPDVYRGLAATQATRGGQAKDAFAADAATQAEDRARQQRLIDQIGTTPSVVDLQARQGRAALARALASQAGSTQGGFSPAAARAALLARGQGEAAIASQSALAKAQEQRAALQAQLAGTGQMRAQDLTNAQLTPVQQEVLRKSLGQQAAFSGLADQTAVTQVSLADQRERDLIEDQLRLYGIGQGVQSSGPGAGQQVGGIVGGLAGIIASLAASDERSKTDKEYADDAVEELLDRVQGYSYRYKDTSMPGTAPGKQYGVMAQDLSRSEIGRGMVHQGEDGYMRVDYSPAKATPVLMAALGNINKRLRKMENGSGNTRSATRQ